MKDWVTIKNLKAKDSEISNREIARHLGISHNTVKSALEKPQAPRYEREEKENPLLEPFREIVFEMVNVKHLKGSRILSELRSKGYKGGMTAFYRFLNQIKFDQKRKYFTPYETAPGEQSQFDWSPYTVKIGGILTRIYIYSYVNSFSRYQILEVSTSQTQGSVLEALENSIIESGGVPERIQTDNAKAFVINASREDFQWNPHYLNLSAHYHFTPSRSLPGHPWSKGKVERPFSYIETHFIQASEFTDFLDLTVKLKEFQSEYNKRVHSVIKTSPLELFEKERQSLMPLPEERYIGIKEELRKVSFDCLLSYNGSRYSVPWMFAGKTVWIRQSRGITLQVFSSANKLICQHTLSEKKGNTVINLEHYKNKNIRSSSLSRLQYMFLEEFPGEELFLEKLKAQKRISAKHQLMLLLEISKMYNKEDFLKAIRKSMEYEVFTHSFIAGYLENNCKQSFDLKPVRQTSKGNVAVSSAEKIKSNMDQYDIFS